MGVHGWCDIFEPQEGFFCAHPAKGVPDGMIWNTTSFEHMPFPPPWKNLKGALIHAFNGPRWATIMWWVQSMDTAKRAMYFGDGGFQIGVGLKAGHEWFIENVMELLDHPNEFYFDEANRKLYVFHNSTGAPPAQGVVATRWQTMLTVQGTMTKPVKGLTISGVGIRDTASTFMYPHGVPSGGDWSLAAIGGVVLEGTENMSIKNCTFTRLDGNGIMVLGYHRGLVIAGNEFEWIGESAMASWGKTKGFDGTPGEFPVGTQVLYNVAREIGITEKQSSCWFQAKTAQTLIKGNICFNGPRAGININDNLGGGTVLEHNLVFNMVRETKDHGPFNSWDRQPFFTTMGKDAPVPGITPKMNVIKHNFLISGWDANWAIDTDGSSSYWDAHHNFLVYGSGFKSNTGGMGKLHHHNLDAYVYLCMCHCDWQPYRPGFEDQYFSNKCVIEPPLTGAVLLGWCNTSHVPALSGTPLFYNNSYYTTSGKIGYACGAKELTLKQYQSYGGAKGSTQHSTPDGKTVVGWGTSLLGFSL
eukprot:TRINITY_DN33261_c0_g1_i1.p1 TRINITY_DN33261_c0_g1~~TRINITY_DN33261_c0_g1_i1.p1  ORF type:complete len:529 (-),score=47.31 TRINITY_DN33261_c0_g1_i1:125-1711(-)